MARPANRLRKPATDPADLLGNLLGKLSLVLLLIGGCALAWKKGTGLRGKTGGARPAAPPPAVPCVTNTLTLAPQRFLHVVTVGTRQLLVSSTPQQVALVAELSEGQWTARTEEGAEAAPAPEPPATMRPEDADEPGADSDQRFTAILRRLQAQPLPFVPGEKRVPADPEETTPAANGSLFRTTAPSRAAGGSPRA